MPGFDLTVPDQILVVILGGLGLVLLRKVVIWSIGALADAIVTAINGKLGLDAIRSDVAALTKRVDNVPELRAQIENLEGQLEALLTEGDF